MLVQISKKFPRQILEMLKSVLGMERYIKYYLFYRRVISGYYILTNGVRKAFMRNLFRSGYQLNQQPLIWLSLIPELSNSNEFVSFLKDKNIRFFEGGWSIYIPPQIDLEKILGKITEFYPADAGYKIVKDFKSPENARYVNKKNESVSWPETVLVGNLFSQFNAACVAELLCLSPKIYDLVEIKATSVSLSCFVVQHIDGTHIVTLSDFDLFISRLDAHVKSREIQTVVPYMAQRHTDFSPPDCNHNLVKSSDERLYYVDFQQFSVVDHKELIVKLLASASDILSFGDVHPFRSRKPYLYQTIPGVNITGKRDTEMRWEVIREMLTVAQIDITRRVILDICCNSGVMLSQALIDGALWGLGWDLPEVVDLGIKIQRTLGFSRITMFPAQLSEHYSLIEDIDERFNGRLSGSIVFYLAAWNHIGFVAELAEIPWKALVFEGHEDREDYSEVVTLMKEKCQARLAGQKTVIDGDSLPRQLLLFVR